MIDGMGVVLGGVETVELSDAGPGTLEWAYAVSPLETPELALGP